MQALVATARHLVAAAQASSGETGHCGERERDNENTRQKCVDYVSSAKISATNEAE